MLNSGSRNTIVKNLYSFIRNKGLKQNNKSGDLNAVKENQSNQMRPKSSALNSALLVEINQLKRQLEAHKLLTYPDSSILIGKYQKMIKQRQQAYDQNL